jgi:tRNA pseudouridine55 synthase
VKGKKSYLLAREGKEVKLEPRRVVIRELEITAVRMPDVHFRVLCSKGTYIRSLAHDFGKAMHSGAWLTQLCRTRIGEFNLSDAYALDEFITLVKTLERR